MASTAAKPPRTKKRFAYLRNMRWYSWLLMVALLGYRLAFIMHWDDRALLWFQERFESKAGRHASIWLPDYHVDIDAKVLPGMEKDEASDLSYNPVTKTLFAVMGKNAFLVELTLTGDVLRKIPLVGWSNPEGVAVMNDGLIAITDERQHKLTIVKVNADTTTLNIADFPQYELGKSANQNKGFEGIAWDPQRQQLILGEERPPALYTWKSNGSDVLTGDKQPLPSRSLDMRNLSSLSIDPRTGHMLALSADSHMLLEVDDQGEQVSFMTLLGGMNGLKDTIPRAEGVALDEAGTLYMVSEPNLFYSFHRALRKH
ncbi:MULTISPECIES: SdiA-regulated domain-containing protein [Pseudomonas syringae group]|uniref:SdiA-regulated n=4 Tax=Pseudomonas syringae group TaxID=136849 RepID=F3G999_PSESJ|nr:MULTISPECIES: SdiA-regulated domain-containing protein [Pseudomonas syringae group]EGH43649.1 SdiA-regulated [Pseudomonas syringae pv. pisi str. 1704B]RMU73716.1 SdiA-regulated [Pseudomonas syringae pv. aptata]PYD09818.1 DNA-binding protein [Pseudomonas syringae pv. pisi]PYD28018.1 DNA-binding protein [Pseudomonas syringae pv. pisi]PYD29172.1 DNA-binding protein [Pseudomonas syringae pv. pisi]